MKLMRLLTVLYDNLKIASQLNIKPYTRKMYYKTDRLLQ